MAKFNLYAFADEAGQSLESQIAAMKRNNQQGLEIRTVDGKNVSDLDLSVAKEYRKQMDDAGLKVWSIGSPIGKIDIEKDDFAAHMDKLRHTLEVAEVLGAENIRMFSFYVPQDKDPAIFRSCVIDRLGEMVEAAKGCTAELCHENEKGIFGDNAARCLDILTNVPQLKGIFDPANFVQVGQDTLQAWDMLAPYIKYMHIKDALADGKVVPAGTGLGNVAAILKMYAAKGGNALTLEPHLFDFSGLKALEREGQTTKLGDGTYESPDAAFDAAANALKGLIEAM